METIALRNRESAQDVWYGQIVTIVARWFFIATGLLLTYWLADDVNEAMLPSYLLLSLVGLNFVLHGRFLTGSPMRREVIFGACLLDAVIVSSLIFSSRWDGAEGINNPYYIFYYPLLLGVALVFPWRVSFAFAAVTIATYSAAVFMAGGATLGNETLEPFMARVVTMATTAALGALFWRIQRQYRRCELSSAGLNI